MKTLWNPSFLPVAVLMLCISLVTGCKEEPPLEWTQERSQSSISGQFLTKDPDTIEFPVKVLFAIDCSLSMGQDIDGAVVGADPSFQRIEAVRNFIEEYNQNDNVSFEIMLWSANVFERTRNEEGQFGFTKNVEELNRVLDAVRNDTFTNYAGTLAEIKSDIQRDINIMQETTNMQRTKYMVVFLSDGIPQGTGNQEDSDLESQVDSIVDMTRLADVGSFSFHTFLLLGGFAPNTTGEAQRAQATTTLKKMADAGDGRFTEFQNAQAIDFLNLVDLRISVEYLLKYVIAYNMNTKPGTELLMLDTDGDGMSDAEEAVYGTNPTLRDTDNDGASDFVEYSLTTPENPFDPRNENGEPDNNCIPGINGIWPDTDGDLLNDCEEELIGTDRRVVDTDGDGIPDGLEFLAGTNVFSAEDVVDSDFDGRPNPVEIREHTNVNSVDPKIQERYAYEYRQIDRGKVAIDQGSDVLSVRRLFTLAVDNIDIMDVGHDPETRQPYDTSNQDRVDFVPGQNTIQLFLAQVPADRPDDPPFYSKVTFDVNIDGDKNFSGDKKLEFHSDELAGQAGIFSLPLNDLN